MQTKPPKAPQLNFDHIKRSLILKQTHPKQQVHPQGIQRHSLHLAIPVSPLPIHSTHSPSIRYKEPLFQEKSILLNSLNQARFSILELNNHKIKILKNNSGSIDFSAASNNKNNLIRLRQAPRSLGVCSQMQNTCKSLASLPKKEELKSMKIPSSTTHHQNNNIPIGQVYNSQYQVQEPFKRDSSIGLALPVENFFRSNKLSSELSKSKQIQQQQQKSLRTKLIHLKEKISKIQVIDQLKDCIQLNEATNYLKQSNQALTQKQKQKKSSPKSCIEPQQIAGNEKKQELEDNLQAQASRESKGSADSQESQNSSTTSLFFGMKDPIVITRGKNNIPSKQSQQTQQQEQQRIENNRRQQQFRDSIYLSQSTSTVLANISKDSFSTSLGRKLMCEESEEGTENIPQIFQKQVSPEVDTEDNQNNRYQVNRITKNSVLSRMQTQKNHNVLLIPSLPEANQIIPKQDSPKIIPGSVCGSTIALQIAMMSISSPLKGKAKASSTDFRKFQLTKERIYCKFHSDNKKKAHNEFIQSFFPSHASLKNKIFPQKFM